MKKIAVLLAGALCAGAGFSESGPLTMEQALKRAREYSPELQAARLNTQAAERQIDAAGRWINPTLEVEAEGLGGDNDLFSDGEYRVGIEQQFQLGGKRTKEQAEAVKNSEAVRFVISEKLLDLDARVRAAFIEMMAQQETGKVRAEQEQLGRAFVNVAKRRYEAGGGSELDVVQAELALEEIILQQTSCFGDLKAAKETLSSLTGIPAENLPEVTAPYYDPAPLIRLTVDRNHPALRRLSAQTEQVRAQAAYAQAQDISDISLGAGYRYEAAEENSSFILSASMPLSFVKRGRAEHAAGMLRAEALQAEHLEMQRKLRQELATVTAQYEGALAEVELIKNKLIPKAEQAYELSRKGYDAGRFSWLELISAQQNLADIRIRHIEALRDAHLAYAQISQFMKEGI